MELAKIVGISFVKLVDDAGRTLWWTINGAVGVNIAPAELAKLKLLF